MISFAPNNIDLALFIGGPLLRCAYDSYDLWVGFDNVPKFNQSHVSIWIATRL